MKFEIELDKYDIGQMQKNRYGHNDTITYGYMLDIVHNIVEQIQNCEDCGLEHQELFGGLCEDCDSQMFMTFWTGDE
jgi:hypothetical protein